MALVQVDTNNEISDYGRHTPKSNPNKVGVSWAVVNGPNDALYRSVRDHQSGIPVGNDNKLKIAYSEYKDKGGKTNDITIGKHTLREMVCSMEDVNAKHAYEAELSKRQIQQSQELEKGKAAERGSSADFQTEEVSLDSL